MNTIYKYELEVKDECRIKMPLNAQILSMQNQNKNLVLWAYVDTDNEQVERVFDIYGTGHPMDNKYDRLYHASVQIDKFVWHIYERFEV